MEGPLSGSPWLAPISSVMISCHTKDSSSRRLGSPLVCLSVYFNCRSRESHKDVLTLDYCTKQLRERERERETVMVLSHVNKNEVCEGPSYSCQNLIFSTFCFRSVKPKLANLSGKFSNEVQVCFVVDIANKSNPPWFHQWRTRSAILIGVNHPCIISVIQI